MLTTDIQQCSSCERIPGPGTMSRWADEAFSSVSGEDAEVTIRIVDRGEGAVLNQKYRNVRRATNVLSFDYANDPHSPPGVLGDVVICAAVVDEEASAQQKDFDAHWAHMVVHGILHLCGYDHTEEEAAQTMEKLETEILSRLGFPAPYA